MVTIEWPDKPDGSPIEYVASIKTAVIFKDAQNKEAAKEFMRFFLAAGESRAAARGLARPLVPGRQAASSTRRTGTRPDDPHRVVEVRAVHAAAADRLAALPQLQAHRHQRRERLRQGGRPRRPRGLVGGGRRRRADRAHQAGRRQLTARSREGACGSLPPALARARSGRSHMAVTAVALPSRQRRRRPLVAGDGLGHDLRHPLCRGLPGPCGLAGRLRGLAGLHPGKLPHAVLGPDLPAARCGTP